MNELAIAFEMLKKTFTAHEARTRQIRMAEPVFSYLKMKRNLLGEVGAAIVKSFVRLISAILSNQKTFVSNASTVALRDMVSGGNPSAAINNSDEKEYNESLAKTILKAKGGK